jgi:thermitase
MNRNPDTCAAPQRRAERLRPSFGLRCAAALAFGLAALVAGGAAEAQQPTRWIDGELLIGFRAGVGPAERSAVYGDHGATFVEDIGQNLRVVRVRVPAPALEARLRALQGRPEIRFVEKNYVFEPALSPNDPQFASQWHLPRILAPEAWDTTQGAAGVVIAILDSGIDATHPDFAGKLVAGYNTYNNTTTTTDQVGHGTEVAGAAGALTNNGQGVAGVAGAAPIMPVRVTDSQGRATSASLASGISWATDHGARVVNLSFNGIVGNSTIRTAAEYAVGRGTLVVAASGNCGCVDPTPENPFVLSVSATDEGDAVASFSSTGPFVDLSAPGSNILTTERFGLYAAVSGTSLASPIVAGVAGLMLAINPALTPGQVTQLLEASSYDPGGNGYDERYGYGRVDAAGAVAAAAGYTPPPDTTAPTVAMTAPISGATVSGTTVVSVSASDNVGVVKVDLYVDGVYFVSDTATPYSFAWNTTALADGSHTLQAVASDAANNSASTASIAVTVANNVNHPPVAVNDAFSAPYRPKPNYTAQVLAVLANDSDADGNLNPASVRIVSPPNKGGTVTVNTNGTVSYTPKKGYKGVESFGYTVKDSLGATSNTATATVTVQ